MPKMPKANLSPDKCRACGRALDGQAERCMSHGTHCRTCCPAGIVSGKLPGGDRGEDLPFETEKPEIE